MQNRFDGKVIAMAGGTGGIGSGVSERIAAEGGTVIVGDINMQAAEQTVATIKARGGKAVPVKLDIGDEDSVKSFIQTAIKTYGGIDGCHVNGLDSSRTAEDSDAVAMDVGVFDHTVRVNMRGYYLCTRHAVPAIIARGGGCMLYTSSAAGHIGEPVRPAYAMVKSAINALARHVAHRFGKQGVRSNTIAPGIILHDVVRKTMGPAVLDEFLKITKTPRLGEPRDIGAMAALLMSDDGAFVTGQVISVDGGMTMRP
jgi:NAD(P)-dependent dehydrogenase (short-subunit alcohol dehydrogenase family)